MAVTYRQATLDDADELGLVHTASWQGAYRGLISDDALDALDPADKADGFRGGLPADQQRARNITWIVAEEEGRIVGHAVSQLHEGTGYLHMLYLLPEAFGTGVGDALHAMALRGLHRVGARSAQLTVLKGNDRAIRFYERRGWKLTGVETADEWEGISVNGLEMAIDLTVDVLAQNEQYWADMRDWYAEKMQWNPEPSWGVFSIPDADVGADNRSDGGIFPDVADRDVIEIGCGAAYVSYWALRRGARTAIGLDLTRSQLDIAAQRVAEHDVDLPLIQADGHRLPFADNSFDVAINEYGAAIWCDPHVWIPEAARVLRPGGTIWFLGNAVQAMLCAPEFEGQMTGTQLLRAQRGMHRMEWLDTPNVEFHVSHGEMIAILTGAGFVIDAMHELYVPADTPETDWGFFDGDWASRWPVEEVWVAHLPG